MNVKLTTELITATFTEWERRYREDPAKFMSEAEKLLKETPASYGESCTPLFPRHRSRNRRIDH